MNQRERNLAIVVGGLLGCVVLWWGFDKYRKAVTLRSNQIYNLEEKRTAIDDLIMKGVEAEVQLMDYADRSLPPNADQAKSTYQQWLFDIGQQSNVKGLKVTPATPAPVDDLYVRLQFTLSGTTSMSNLVQLLYDFYAMDYLHQIQNLTVNKSPQDNNELSINLTIHAIALLDASADIEPPTKTSWQIEGDYASYFEPIMNRNFFQPPNQAPRFRGNSTVEAVVGRDNPIQLAFEDPERHRLRFSFAEDPPEFVRLDERSGTLRVRSDEKREFTVLVRAIDDGFPQQSIEQTVKITVVDPPPPEEEDPPPLKFDDASQTVLTGITHGGKGWSAWLNVRTRDLSLRLLVGDKFEIGSVKGQVIEVTREFAVLEVDDRRFTIKIDDKLKDAADKSLID